MKILIGNQAIITLGNIYDPEENAMNIKLETFELNKKTLPAFMSFNKETMAYSLAPKIIDKVKKYTLVVKLTDTFGASNIYKFNVEIYN